MFENIKSDFFVKRETWKNWNIPERIIKNHEIVFVKYGKGTITLMDKKYKVEQNSLVYIPPNTKHSLQTDNDFPMCFYAMHFNLLEEKTLPIPLFSKFENSYKLTHFFKELELANSIKNSLNEWQKDILTNNILFEIISSNTNINSPSSSYRINKLLKYIHSSYSKDFTTSELCEKSKLKKTMLMKLFKQVTGYTPLQYCLNLKIENAKDLLSTETSLSISEISFKCGFSDPLYFSRIFKKQTGFSPSEFRTQIL